MSRKERAEQMEQIFGRIVALETQVKQLQCPHDKGTRFESGWIPMIVQGIGFTGEMVESVFLEECVECGAIVRRFGTKKEFLEAKLAAHRAACRKESTRLGSEIAAEKKE